MAVPGMCYVSTSHALCHGQYLLTCAMSVPTDIRYVSTGHTLCQYWACAISVPTDIRYVSTDMRYDSTDMRYDSTGD
eukprot:480523-Rhodomonas_salina.3